MRGASKTPPKYRKHRKTGQAVVTLSGKDFYLGLHGSKASKQQYDMLVAQWLANGRLLPKSESKRAITVSDLMAAYWKFAKGFYVKNGKPTGEIPPLKSAVRTFRKAYGTKPVDEVGPLLLIAYQNMLVKDGLCRKYVNQQTGRIKRAFKWGVSRELVPVGVHQALATVSWLRKGKTSATEYAPVEAVPDDVVNATLAHVPYETTRAMIRFQRLVGCRPGELFILRSMDIDRTGGGHDGVWLYRPESHKTEHHGQGRVVVIGPEAQKVLSPFLPPHREESELCFQRRSGKPFARLHYSQAIHRACRKAFPPPEGTVGEALKRWEKEHHWTPNQLRHATATTVRREHGLEAAQVVAGHANARTTEIYAERDIAKAAQVMAKIG
ncbi:tyrosine-type recombinase/integrase [Mariniblastus fucicola]|uniref:Site-specific tyrosine recombinase XerC n=1 Tax=Mariniblastus fucicola TaxID=980251 RepID=A0A5B9PFD7_9BACT|nr:site-specific integrase [Mariniblastus fucicola]QEG23900.1 site-specific tyrosine recombinase XerC [Mariniblastus fucicola]